MKVSTWYTVIIFTASLPEYADPVIDWLDGGDGSGGMVSGRLFRSVRMHPFFSLLSRKTNVNDRNVGLFINKWRIRQRSECCGC